MKYRMIFCPLERGGRMALLPEVMEKLDAGPGGEISIMEVDGLLLLCGRPGAMGSKMAPRPGTRHPKRNGAVDQDDEAPASPRMG